MSKARVFQSLVFSAALWAVEAHAATAPPPPKQPCAWEPKFGTWMLQRTPTDPAGGSPNDINRNLGQTVTLSVQSIQRRFVNDGDEMWSFGGSAVSNTGATGRVEGQLYRHKEKRYWQPDTLIHWNNGYRDDHVFDVNSVNDGTIDGYYYGLDVLQNTPPPILHITTFYWFEGQNEADNTKLALAGGAGGRSRLSLPFQCKPPASPQDPIDSPFFKPTGAGIEPAKPHVNPADPAFRFFPPVRSGSSPPPSQPPPPQPAPPAVPRTGGERSVAEAIGAGEAQGVERETETAAIGAVGAKLRGP